MSKKGFSLSELIIALGIIGVVAALVIPQFSSNSNNKPLAAKLSATVTEVENTFGMMLYDEDKEVLSKTEFGRATSDSARKTALEKYTTILQFGTKLSDLNYSSSCSASLLVQPVYADGKKKPDGSANSSALTAKTINGSDTKTLNFNYGFKIGNGAVVFIYLNNQLAQAPEQIKVANLYDSIKTYLKGQPAYAAVNTTEWRRVWIDVNGGSKPNTLGRDIFAFVIGNDGHLYPYGSFAAAELLGKNGQSWNAANAGTDLSCTGSKYSGMGCTARLMENGYKIDY